MAETISSANDKTVVVPSSDLNKLWTLTIVSLVLNTVIIALFLVGAIIRHHQMHRGMEEGRLGGRYEGQRDRGFGPGGFSRMDRDQRGDRDGGGRFGGRALGGVQGMGGMGPERPGPPDTAKLSELIMRHLAQRLALTDDEAAKIKPIVDQQVAEMQKQRETRRAAIKKQIEDTKGKIKPLLTAEQQKQMDAMPIPGSKPGQ